METLRQRVLLDGQAIGTDILKVDSFLNHQLDVALLDEIGGELYRRFQGDNITRILTIEASGIAVACAAARLFGVPVVFAKKGAVDSMPEDSYTAECFSFTRGQAFVARVSHKYLNASDQVLVVDDFLANGRAAMALCEIVRQANAALCGVGIVIEKGFQGGRKVLQDAGVRVESLVVVERLADGEIVLAP